MTRAQLVSVLTSLRNHYGQPITDVLLAEVFDFQDRRDLARLLGPATGKPNREVLKDDFLALLKAHWPDQSVPELARQAGISRETGYRLFRAIGSSTRTGLLTQRAYKRAMKDILLFLKETHRPLTSHYLCAWDSAADSRIKRVMTIQEWRIHLGLPTDLYTRLPTIKRSHLTSAS